MVATCRQFLFVVSIFQIISNVFSSGKIEMQLKLLKNDQNRDESGRCCGRNDTLTPFDSFCSKKCSTYVRICLKQYQSVISSSDYQNCTYGSKIVQWKDDGSDDHFTPMSFPFPFSWIGDLTFIIEVWHAPTGFNDATSPRQKASLRDDKQLLLRVTQRKSVSIGRNWTQESHRNSFNRLDIQYRVTCDDHYFGSNCAAYCKPRDDTFGHFYCSPTGRKVCVDGWKGNACSEAQCLPGCHPEFGMCSRPNECTCRLGYAGQYCDQCMRYPGCQHGTCKLPYECSCDEGWGGLFCNQDLNYCTHHKPCLNGATCTNTGAGHYTCTCRLGYTGVNCETKIETCDLRPCFNGATCRESGTNYTCICPEGYSGKHCQTFAKTCSDKPCENGASCMNNGGANGTGYTCLCAPGWEGVNCDIEMDMCQSSPCSNGGSCMSHFGSFTCLCPTGYVGDNCEINRNDCSAQSCLNGGTCIDEVDNFKCICKAGFFGTLCQFNVDDCVKRPCANGGTCFDLVNDYRCECRPGFKGKDCSIDVNECESNPCRYGATCEDLVNDYVCHCLPCYSGKDCRQRDDKCLWSGRRIYAHHGGGVPYRKEETPTRILTTPSNEPASRPVVSYEHFGNEPVIHYGSAPTSHGLSSPSNDLGANLPLLIGLPLVVVFVIIMVVLIVIILCLLKKYKRSPPTIMAETTRQYASKSDEEACRENLQNMRIAALAARQSKNLRVNNNKNENHVIYNNTQYAKDGNNRTSTVYEVSKKDCLDDVADANQYFDHKTKNNLNILSSNLDEQSKIYKIVSLEKLQQPTTTGLTCPNNLYASTSYDSINDDHNNDHYNKNRHDYSNHGSKRTIFYGDGVNRNDPTVNGDDDEGVICGDTSGGSNDQSSNDINVTPPNGSSSSYNKSCNHMTTIGQLSPLRTEDLRLVNQQPLAALSSHHNILHNNSTPLHRHHKHNIQCE